MTFLMKILITPTDRALFASALPVSSGLPILQLNGPIASIRLNRPNEHNRIQLEDIATLHEHFDAVEANRNVRVLVIRSEEHTSELQSLMRISYAVFCLKKKKQQP